MIFPHALRLARTDVEKVGRALLPESLAAAKAAAATLDARRPDARRPATAQPTRWFRCRFVSRPARYRSPA
jgi:hypothetical protein